MSELKTRFITDTYLDYFESGKHDLAQIYLKSEADKVIAEKDAEICKLRRALWLARADKANKVIAYANCRISKRENDSLYFREVVRKWQKVEQLCMAKAEEYK